MAVIHKEKSKESINKDIFVLKYIKTWNVGVRKHLPERLTVLTLTWDFNIKRYHGGRFCKFKAIFCVRGSFQQ